MHTLLYLIWFSLPVFFFGIALWSKLEQMSGEKKRANVGDFMKQGIFVTACVGLAVLIDTYVLKDFVEGFSPDFIPLGFYQVMLLPLILYIGAVTVGPTRDVKIERKKKAPPPPKKKRR